MCLMKRGRNSDHKGIGIIVLDVVRSIFVSGLAISLLLSAGAGEFRSDALGLRFDPRNLLESCEFGRGLECEFPIFVSVETQTPSPCASESTSFELCRKLPAQLASRVLSFLDGDYQKSCKEVELLDDLNASLAVHSERTGTVDIVDLSASFAGCMRASGPPEKSRRILLIFENGRIPGYVNCSQISLGFSCILYFSRPSVLIPSAGFESSSETKVDRIEISSFRPDDIGPFLRSFPGAIKDAPIDGHPEVVAALEWLGDILGNDFLIKSSGE